MIKVLLFFVLSFSSPLWAWGPLGHRTVGHLAEGLLPPKTAAQVRALMDGQSFADASTWADSLRGFPETWKHTFPYHFESISDGCTYLKSIEVQTENQRYRGGLLTAVLESERILRDPKSQTSEKKSALKFLIHFVGDAHQPLHTGRPEDLGGNKIHKNWNGQNTNLHAIWDGQLILEAYGNQFESQGKQEADDLYAEILKKKFQNTQIDVQADNIEAWINESMLRRTEAYTYAQESEAAYTKRFIDLVDKQVYSAGVRLAAVLERLMKTTPEAQPQMDLRKALEALLGPLQTVIHFGPRPAQEDKEPSDSLVATKGQCQPAVPLSDWHLAPLSH